MQLTTRISVLSIHEKFCLHVPECVCISVFSESSDKLGCSCGVKHHIDIINAKSIKEHVTCLTLPNY